MCPCGDYSTETRRHILHKCKKYNNYRNPKKNTLAHFILFLEECLLLWRKHHLVYSRLCFSYGLFLISFPFLFRIIFLSLFFSFYFSCCLLMNVRNYVVVTAVCRRAPHYKLLIGKKKSVVTCRIASHGRVSKITS